MSQRQMGPSVAESLVTDERHLIDMYCSDRKSIAKATERKSTRFMSGKGWFTSDGNPGFIYVMMKMTKGMILTNGIYFKKSS